MWWEEGMQHHQVDREPQVEGMQDPQEQGNHQVGDKGHCTAQRVDMQQEQRVEGILQED